MKKANFRKQAAQAEADEMTVHSSSISINKQAKSLVPREESGFSFNFSIRVNSSADSNHVLLLLLLLLCFADASAFAEEQLTLGMKDSNWRTRDKDDEGRY